MQDRRLVNRMQNYWDLIRRGKPIPDIDQFNISSVDDMWEQCMRLDVQKSGAGHSFICNFMGSQLVTMFGRDLTGSPVDQRMTQYPINIISKKLEAVGKDTVFTADEGFFVNNKGRRVGYRSCYMPFGNEKRGLTHVIVAYSSREF